MACVARLVVDARLVQRDVDAVAVVVAERRHVERPPAPVVRDVHAVVLIVVDCAVVDVYVSCSDKYNVFTVH